MVYTKGEKSLVYADIISNLINWKTFFLFVLKYAVIHTTHTCQDVKSCDTWHDLKFEFYFVVIHKQMCVYRLQVKCKGIPYDVVCRLWVKLYQFANLEIWNRYMYIYVYLKIDDFPVRRNSIFDWKSYWPWTLGVK